MAPAVTLEGDDCALFASDMHLGDHEPALARRFTVALGEACVPGRTSAAVTHVFLLGDLFEAWVGDDQPDHSARELGDLLRTLNARGVRVLIMRGNRDFLLGTGSPSWPQTCGAALLEDPITVALFGTRVALAHGDALCTDDRDYQRFRVEVRAPAWQQGFLARPLAERLAVARHMREQSEVSKVARAKASLPMDVNETAVRALAREADVPCLIHGHTHRPDRHEADGLVRWVLPDWDADGGRGGFLRVDAQGWHRLGHWA